jgi:type II secretory pathway predicted ATPase ExeA
MNLDLSLEIGTAGPARPATLEIELLPSRRNSLNETRTALDRSNGLVVLTGDPGVGKSMLRRALEAESPPSHWWVVIEVTPGTTSRNFYRSIARALRVEPEGFERPELLEFLAERHLDNERWTLAIEEAQNLDAAMLEEVRVLANRLGEPDGPAAILLIGQTRLARRLEDRANAGLRSRVAGHVHLHRLDADEVGTLLRALHPKLEWPVGLVDRIHLTSRGLPAHVLELARFFEHRPVLTTQPTEPEEPARQSAVESESRRSGPLVGPAKPPIRVEEGLIEVGWQPETGSGATEQIEDTEVDDLENVRPGLPDDEASERINDHYAALQAWHEWATNQGRQPEYSPVATSFPPPPAEIESPALAANPLVWADEEHGYAPFGRLFTRLAQENETE